MHADRPLQLCHFWQVFTVVLVLSHLSWLCQVCILHECPCASSASHVSQQAVKCSHLALTLHAHMQLILICHAMLLLHVSLGCHVGTYVQHFICYHSLAQATADEHVVALLSGSLKCSMARVVSDLSNSHHRVMQQVQTGLLASNKLLSVCTVTWCIRICFKSRKRALMHTPSCVMRPVLAHCRCCIHYVMMQVKALGTLLNLGNVHICVWPANIIHCAFLLLEACLKHCLFEH